MAESYTTKVLIEYLNGTWWGYSTRVDHNLEQAQSNSDNIIGVEEEITEYDLSKMNIIAFVIDVSNSRKVYNAQSVKAGKSIDFD